MKIYKVDGLGYFCVVFGWDWMGGMMGIILDWGKQFLVAAELVNRYEGIPGWSLF